jgi:hypothetical protein
MTSDAPLTPELKGRIDRLKPPDDKSRQNKESWKPSDVK